MYKLKTIFAAVLFAVMGIMLLNVQDTFALGISPSRLEFDNLMPGVTIERKFVISRADSTQALPFTIASEGDIEDWVTTSEGETFLFPAGKQRYEVNVVLKVPDDAEVGDYSGKIRFKSQPPQNATDQVGISLGVAVSAQLTVVSEKDSSWRVNSVAIPSVEESNILRTLIRIRNEGNTVVKPSKIEIEIHDVAKVQVVDTLVLSSFTNNDGIAPFAYDVFRVDVPTNLATGNYWANVSVYGDNDVLVKKDVVSFGVVGVGELRKDGRLTNVRIKPRNAQIGDQVEITGTFKNTGSVSVPASILAELYLDGTLMLIQESDVTTVAPNTEQDLSVRFSPSEKGHYTLHVYSNYDSTNTPIQEFSYNVGYLNYAVIVAFALGAILILILFMLAYKHEWNHKKPKPRGRKRK